MQTSLLTATNTYSTAKKPYSYDKAVREMNALLQECTLCPRACHINRLKGQRGFCGQTAALTAARAALHYWEEPCISGQNGSGAVFFAGCGLRCVFCQNHDIALSRAGREISIERLSDIFLELQKEGANNINLVTPSHFIPQIRCALILAKEKGLSLPVVYNTGSYEEVSALRLMEGLVDIYLPDLKFFSPRLSQTCSNAPDYFEKSTAAIAEMFRQVQTPIFVPEEGRSQTDAAPASALQENPAQHFSNNMLLRRGIIVRHLVLPGQAKDSKKILRYLHETYRNDIYVSIMNQYTPLTRIDTLPELNHKVSPEEYSRVLHFAEAIGIENGFRQEDGTVSESFIPPFNYTGL